ncbi:MAG: hypothetical protein ABJG41_08610 [Cyclobacteriaceae bacterium]
MRKKFKAIIFFLIVFGLPVSWYLILQIFGENKFDLPVLEQLNEECVLINDTGYLQIDTARFAAHKTEWKKIKNQMSKVSPDLLQIVYDDRCMEGYDMAIVDEKGQLRGAFGINREDTDRLLTEIDIYINNIQSIEIK